MNFLSQLGIISCIVIAVAFILLQSDDIGMFDNLKQYAPRIELP